MPEPSVVSEPGARDVLRQRYGIADVQSVDLLPGGSANCREVRASEGHFVLKEFQRRFSVGDVETEPAVTQFAAARGIPTAEFVPTLAGDYVWDHAGRAFHLQRFVEGHIYGQNCAPDWLLWESARMFGRLHAVLADFPMTRCSYSRSWLRWDPEAKKRQYAGLIELAEALPADQRRERILADLQYRAGLMRAECHAEIHPERLTYVNCHGDYHVLQLICGERSIRAVIDFSGAGRQPLALTLIRSYSLGDPACKEGRLDAERIKEYVCAYIDGGGVVSRYDLRTMPHLYFFQLSRSGYGYQEHLTQGREGYLDGRVDGGLEGLLEFGFWRTEVCRQLEGRVQELAGQLEELAE